MNRREFFARVTTGVVGAYVASTLPIKWLPAPMRVEGLQMAMVRAFNEFVKGRNLKKWGDIKIYASSPVFQQFESELIALQRFSPKDHDSPDFVRHLNFKGVSMYDTGKRDGFWFSITDGTRILRRWL